MEKGNVYPVYKNQFKIGATKETATVIKGMESFGVSFDNGVEEWSSFEDEGWTNRLPTSKGVTISIAGKRVTGDKGNDFIANLAFKNGTDAYSTLIWTFPDGTEVIFEDAVISITSIWGGDSTTVAPLEFDVLSNGKPDVILP